MNKIYNAKNILFIILLFNFAFSTHLFSQNNYKRKISISEWLEEMEKCKDKRYLLEDTEIYYDYRKDSLYSCMQPRGIMPTAKDKKSEKKNISICPN
jgi:K+ transporter